MNVPSYIPYSITTAIIKHSPFSNSQSNALIPYDYSYYHKFLGLHQNCGDSVMERLIISISYRLHLLLYYTLKAFRRYYVNSIKTLFTTQWFYSLDLNLIKIRPITVNHLILLIFANTGTADVC